MARRAETSHAELGGEFAQAVPLSRDLREWLATSVLPILALAESHITEKQLTRLEAILATLPDEPPTRGTSDFRIRFWSTIAEATGDELVVRMVKQWALVMRAREELTGIDSTGPEGIIPKAVYRGLLLALRRGSGTPEFWASVIDHLLD